MTKRAPRSNLTLDKSPGAAYGSDWRWWHLFAVVTLTLLVYRSSLDNGLTNWDDGEYIVNNADLKDASLHKHFIDRPEVMGNFHPVTMMSLAWSRAIAADPRSGALDARIFHVTDLTLHVLNALLVYIVFFRLSHRAHVAFFTSLLFALHPMHVESVAWASERKDVLHVLFWLGSLACYIGHIRKGGPWWYASCLLLFVLALLSKAMAVSLVPVLFLIDFHQGRTFSRGSILEKLPFVVLAIWAGVRAVAAQQAFESVQDLDVYPFGERVLFACYGLMRYTEKFFMPTGLSAFHGFPMRGIALPWAYWLAPLFVGAVAWMLYRRRTDKDLVFGALFFFATVVLVLQLLPVGGAVIAERYSYLPYVGLAFTLGAVLDRWMIAAPGYRMPVIVGSCLFVFVLAGFAHQRTAVWKNGLSLWSDAFSKDQRSPKILNNYGVALTEDKRFTEALARLDEAIHLKRDYPDAYYNRGLAKYRMGRYMDAIADYDEAIRIKPALAVAWYNRSGAWYALRRPDKALPDALKAQELGYAVDPKFIEVLRSQLGSTGGAPG